TADINGGKMDGFVDQAERARRGCLDTTNPARRKSATPDIMGYHTASDIPNYWSYAERYVLQDRMFEPNASWSLPAHLFEVSEWSAQCRGSSDPKMCVNALESPGTPPDFSKHPSSKAPTYAWTDLTYLMHKNSVSWNYF